MTLLLDKELLQFFIHKLTKVNPFTSTAHSGKPLKVPQGASAESRILFCNKYSINFPVTWADRHTSAVRNNSDSKTMYG